MKKILIKTPLLLCLLLAGQARADEWTTTDTTLEFIYLVITDRDRRQTIECMKTPWCYEHNPLLGSDPSEDKVNFLITLAVLGHIWIATKLDQPYRRIWQSVWIGVEYHAVDHNDSERRNYHVGVKFAF